VPIILARWGRPIDPGRIKGMLWAGASVGGSSCASPSPAIAGSWARPAAGLAGPTSWAWTCPSDIADRAALQSTPRLCARNRPAHRQLLEIDGCAPRQACATASLPRRRPAAASTIRLYRTNEVFPGPCGPYLEYDPPPRNPYHRYSSGRRALCRAAVPPLPIVHLLALWRAALLCHQVLDCAAPGSPSSTRSPARPTHGPGPGHLSVDRHRAVWHLPGQRGACSLRDLPGQSTPGRPGRLSIRPIKLAGSAFHTAAALILRNCPPPSWASPCARGRGAGRAPRPR
jgi:hypothetical protein